MSAHDRDIPLSPMDHPHRLNMTAVRREDLEAVGAAEAAKGLMRAREKTIEVFKMVQRELKAGMTEPEACKLAMTVFADHGVKKHWHRVYARIGAGTCLTFNEPRASGAVLGENDPVYFDLGPVWSDPDLGVEFEGDYGDTFIFDGGGSGTNPSATRCAEAARALFKRARDAWKNENLSGQEIYEKMRRENEGSGYALHPGVLGHRVSDFPHHRFTKANLGTIPFTPVPDLWVLEVHLTDPVNKTGAFFEDLLI
ncbi:MAG: M24 family metallopeptidase [Proteobacteria bacterium]|nr:M24 family metallopeptidase [Pseudomonadota bacterium]